MQNNTFDVVVLGSGPGGYSAAFRAADLGLNVALVERYRTLGGVCLNVGCIPSKALLHAAELLNDCKDMQAHGLKVGDVSWDVDQLRAWKEKVVGQLTGGLSHLSKQRKVKVFHGVGQFHDANTLSVDQEGQKVTITFQHAIIAAGSQPVKLPFLPEDDRIFDSTGALALKKTDGTMLVLGGGIIGCEMATVYSALGCDVTIVEMMDQLMPGADKDLVAPLQKLMTQRGITLKLGAKVEAVKASKKGLEVTFEGVDKPVMFDQILVSVGRKPNGHAIGADAAGVAVDERGFIAVDAQMRTNVPHIFAIGDIVGQPMLAHKAVPEGHLAAEVIAGHPVKFDALCIPSVAYTDPEVAWVGLTETDANAQGIAYEKGVFPWVASGRALCLGRTEGLTKILIEPNTGRVLGGAIVGRVAGDLISEFALAIEMGATAEDLALTIHPHPTLSESVMMSAEMVEGTITDLIAPKKKKRPEAVI